jgi:hypothetical protein
VGERERLSNGLQRWPRSEESIEIARSCWRYRQPRAQRFLEVEGFELVAWVHCKGWGEEVADMERDLQEAVELGDLGRRR